MSKVLTIAGVSVLVLGLILGVALPGLAAPDEALPDTDDSQARIVKGKVLEVREADLEFDIQSGEEELTINVDENTKYYKLCVPGRIVSLARHLMQFRHQNQEEMGVPGGQGMGLGLQNKERALARHQMKLQNQISQPEIVPLSEPQQAKLKWLRPFGEESAFSDIAVGDRVVVWLADVEDGDYLAKMVLIIKPTTYASVSGTIEVDLDEGSITITPDDGEAVTLTYNEGTVFILNGFIAVEEGQYAHAIYAHIPLPASLASPSNFSKSSWYLVSGG
jgi:hypothetical protein